jgi:hypothetical protein
MKNDNINKHIEMQKYTRYLRIWAQANDTSAAYGTSPASFAEWQQLKEQGFQPEEDYVVIGEWHGTGFASVGVNNDDFIKTPHLHVVGHDGKDLACVGLAKAVYVPHGGEEGELEYAVKADLMALLNSYIDYPKFKSAKVTHWDFACLTWNYNNEKQISGKAKMPDYNKL